jgi:Zn-dependent peptidase ImmA (M78 family)
MAIRRRKIEGIVKELLVKNGIKEAPVPVTRIAKACGARISSNPLEGELSGFLYRRNKQAVIGVNTQHAPVRQNFTIAHELGHFLLHDHEEQIHVDHEFRVRFRRNALSSEGTNQAEREANFFAASLLMPTEFLEDDIEDEIDLFDDNFLYRLARKYGVSAQALVNRLKNLGYIIEE